MFQYIFSLILVFPLLFNPFEMKTNDLDLLKEINLTTSPGKKLTASLVNGSVKVSSWSKSEVSVKIYGNDNAKEKLDFNVYNTESGIKVDVLEKDNSGNLNKVTLNVEIQVPEEYTIDMDTKGGNLSVGNVNGKIKLSTLGGNIDVSNNSGSLSGSTKGGNITLNKITGDIDVSTMGGNIDAKDFNGKLIVSTSGGNIELKGSNGSINASTLGGNIGLDYSGENLGIELSTSAGSITLEIPAIIKADLEASTAVGKIKSDFGTPDKSMIGSNLKTKINDGGKLIKCSTNAGNIDINKK